LTLRVGISESPGSHRALISAYHDWQHLPTAGVEQVSNLLARLRHPPSSIFYPLTTRS
jgi:hypothetical protein